MNWFSGAAKKKAEEDAAKAAAAQKTMEAEIRQLYEIGTQREALEGMFSKEDVDRVVEQIDKERALLAMLEAEQKAEDEKKAKEKAERMREIRELYEAGTQAAMLEQLHDPGEVQEVVEIMEKEKAEEEAAAAQAAAEEAAAAKAEDSDHDMTEEERAEMIEDIKSMLRTNTKMKTIESLFKTRYIEEGQRILKKERVQEQAKEIEKAVASIQPNSKLVLHLKGLDDLDVARPVFHIACESKDGAWKVIHKSQPFSEDDNAWPCSKIRLEKILEDRATTSSATVRIKLLEEQGDDGRFLAVGHVDTTVPELLKRAIQQKDLDEAGGDDQEEEQEKLALDIQDRKHNTVASLIVAEASIYTHQETSEEKNAKNKINKSLAKLGQESKLLLSLRAVNTEELGDAELQAFMQVETQSKPRGPWEVQYTSEHIDIDNTLEWKPAKLSCRSVLWEGGRLSPLRISMMDWNDGKTPNTLGSFVATLDELLWRSESNKVSSKTLDDEDRMFPCIDEDNDDEYASIIVQEASILEMSAEEKALRADITERLENLEEHSRLHITLKGVDLKAMKEGMFGNYSDPFFEVSGLGSNGWNTVYTSETINDNVNPEWKQGRLSLDKLLDCGDSATMIRIILMDAEENGDHRRIGFLDTTLFDLLLCSESSIAASAMADDLPFTCIDESGQSIGSIIVVDADIVGESTEEKKSRAEIAEMLSTIDEYSALVLYLKGTDLVNMDGLLGVSDPFYVVLSRGDSDGQWERVYRSEHIDDNQSPVWGRARISLKKLLKGDVNKKLRIEMYDWQESESHQAMGWFHTTLNELLWRSKTNAAAKAVGEDEPFVCRDGADAVYGSIMVDSAKVVTENAAEKEARKEIVQTLEQMDEYTRLRFTMRGTNLVNMDGFLGVSDPFFELKTQDDEGEWTTVFKSNHIVDNHEPLWLAATIPIQKLLRGQVNRTIRVTMTDWQEDGAHQPMGFFETNLLEFLWFAESNKAAVSLGEHRTFLCRDGNDNQYGSLAIVDAAVVMDSPEESEGRKMIKSHLEKVQEGSNLTVELKGKDLANVEGMWGCSDPFAEFAAKTESGEWQTIYRSEHVENNLNPEWKPAIIPLAALLKGDIDRDLKVSLFDWESSGNHQTMGYFETSIQELLWRSQTNEASKTPMSERSFVAKADDGEVFGNIIVASASLDTLEKIVVNMKKEIPDNGANAHAETSDSMEPIMPAGSELLLTMKGVNLENVEGWFGCSDPFFTVSVAADDLSVKKEWQRIHKSEYLENSLNPEWKQAAISMDSLKGNDIDACLLISVFDWEENDEHNPMGFFETSVRDLLKHAEAFSADDSRVAESMYTLRDADGKEYGTIVITGANMKKPPPPKQAEPPEVIPDPVPPTPESSDKVNTESTPMNGSETNTPKAEPEKDSDIIYGDVDLSDSFSSGSHSGGEDDGSHGDDGSFISERTGDYSRDGDDFSGDGSDRGDDDQDGGEPIPPGLKKLHEGSELTLSLMGAELGGSQGCDFPFYEIDVLLEGDDDSWDNVYASEHLEPDMPIIWKPASIPLDFLMDGTFDRVLRISLFDWDESGDNAFIGDFETTVPELLNRVETGKEVIYILEDEDGNEQGDMTVLAAVLVVPEPEKVMCLTLEGKDLAHCSNPFFEVLEQDAGDWKPVYRSDHVKDTSPRWPRSIVGVGEDMDRPMRISLFDWSKDGDHEHLGDFETTANDLLDMGLDGGSSKFFVKDDSGELIGKVFVREAYLEDKDKVADDHQETTNADNESVAESFVSGQDMDDASAISRDRSEVSSGHSGGPSEASFSGTDNEPSQSNHDGSEKQMDIDEDSVHSGSAMDEDHGSVSPSEASTSHREGTSNHESFSHSVASAHSGGKPGHGSARSFSQSGHSGHSDGGDKHDDSQVDHSPAPSVRSEVSRSSRQSSHHSEHDSSASSIDPEKKRRQTLMDIRGLYEAGTPPETLEQMFSPADVAEVAAMVEKDKSSGEADDKSVDSGSSEQKEKADEPPEATKEAPKEMNGLVAAAASAVVSTAAGVDPDVVKKFEDTIAKLESQNEVLQSTCDQLKKEIESLEKKEQPGKKGGDGQSQNADALQSQNDALQATCDQLRKEIDDMQKKETTSDQLKKEIEEMEKKCKDLQEENDTLDEKNTSLQATCDELTKSLKEAEQKSGKFDELKEANSELKKEYEELQDEHKSLEENCSSLQKKTTTLEATSNNLKEELETLQETVEDLERQNAELEEELKAATEEKDSVAKEFADFQAATGIKEKRFLKSLDSMTSKKEAAEEELAELKSGTETETAKLKEENQQLTEKVSTLEASAAENESRVATAKNMLDSFGAKQKEIEALQAKVTELEAGQGQATPLNPSPMEGVTEEKSDKAGSRTPTRERSPTREKSERKDRSEKSPRRPDEKERHDDKRRSDRDKMGRSEKRERDKEGDKMGDFSKKSDHSKKRDGKERERDKDKERRDRHDKDRRREKDRHSSSKDSENKDRPKDERGSKDRERRDKDGKERSSRDKDKDKDRERRHRDGKDRDRDRDRGGDRKDREKDGKSSRDKDKDRERRKEKERRSTKPR